VENWLVHPIELWIHTSLLGCQAHGFVSALRLWILTPCRKRFNSASHPLSRKRFHVAKWNSRVKYFPTAWSKFTDTVAVLELDPNRYFDPYEIWHDENSIIYTTIRIIEAIHWLEACIFSQNSRTVGENPCLVKVELPFWQAHFLDPTWFLGFGPVDASHNLVKSQAFHSQLPEFPQGPKSCHLFPAAFYVFRGAGDASSGWWLDGQVVLRWVQQISTYKIQRLMSEQGINTRIQWLMMVNKWWIIDVNNLIMVDTMATLYNILVTDM